MADDMTTVSPNMFSSAPGLSFKDSGTLNSGYPDDCWHFKPTAQGTNSNSFLMAGVSFQVLGALSPIERFLAFHFNVFVSDRLSTPRTASWCDRSRRDLRYH
jgi:hypothetical protein